MLNFLKVTFSRLFSLLVVLFGAQLVFFTSSSRAVQLGVLIVVVVLAFFRKQVFGPVWSLSGFRKFVVLLAILGFVLILSASLLFTQPFSWGMAGFAYGIAGLGLSIARIKRLWKAIIVGVVLTILSTWAFYVLGAIDLERYGRQNVVEEITEAVQVFIEALGGPTQTPVATSTRMPTVEPDSWYYMACQRRVSNRVGAVIYEVETREPIVGMLIPYDKTVNSTAGYWMEGDELKYIEITYAQDGITLKAYISPADLSTDPAKVQCQQ